MATETLSPLAKQRFYDNKNSPAANAQLFTYQAGTTTKLTSYKNQSGTANTNPIIIDARGECDLWIPPNVAYKYVFAPSTDTDPPTNPYWTVDNIVNSQLVTLYGGIDTGSANAYILTFTASFTSYVDGTIIYWLPSNNNTGASTINVNGLGVVSILNADGSALIANQIALNQFAQIVYRSGAFYLLSPGLISNGSFTVTFATGWTTTPTTTLNYTKIGQWISIYLVSASAVTATSNSATATITGVPAILRPSSTASLKAAPCRVIDNGAAKGGWAYIGNAGTLNLGLGFDSIGGNFTNAGSKGLDVGFAVNYVQS